MIFFKVFFFNDIFKGFFWIFHEMPYTSKHVEGNSEVLQVWYIYKFIYKFELKLYLGVQFSNVRMTDIQAFDDIKVAFFFIKQDFNYKWN